MEMNAANVVQHKIFPGKPSFVDRKKKWMKKADLVSYPRKKYKKSWTRLSQKQQKKPQSSG